MKKSKKKEPQKVLVIKKCGEVNIAQYCKENMKIYGANVNIARVIPDAIDGLKPVQRRALFTMFNNNKLIPGKTTKSADVVGTCLGKYHPHGDSSVYEAIVNMGEYWKLYPLFVDPTGNFGTIAGDDAAAMRYTECSLTPFVYDCCFEEWDNKLVSFKPNYSQSEQEPVYLNTKYPLVMFTGTFGLGYGLYSGMPPYNFNETMDALITLLENPDTEKITLVPDFPTGCDIVGTKKEFEKICEIGEGTVKMRGRIEEDEKGNLHIVSVPYAVTLDKVVLEQIPDLVENTKAKDLFADLINHTTTDKKTQLTIIDVELVLKKGADPELAKEMLYKGTSLESTFKINMEMVYEYDNVHYNMKSYLLDWLDYRKEFKSRYYLLKYTQLHKDYHMLEAIIKIVSDPKSDKVLNKIFRDSENAKEVAKKLIKTYDITDLQAKTISDFKYSKLCKSSLAKYKEDFKKIEKEMKKISKIVHDESLIEKEMIEEFKEAKEKYGIPRKSKLVKPKHEEINDKDYIILITKKGYIKKLNTDFDNIGALEQGDKVVDSLTINNTESLLIFDISGKCFKLPVNDLLVTPLESVGYDIGNYIKTKDRPVKIIKMPSKKKSNNKLIFVTKNGIVKKSDLSNYIGATKNGLIAISLKSSKDDKDYLVDVILQSNKDIIIYTANGMCTRFNTKEIPTTLRTSSGVIGIKLTDDDKVIGMCTMEDKDYLAIVTDKGNAKKVKVKNCILTSRAAEGYKLIAVEDKEKIVGLKLCDKDDKVDVFLNNRIETYPVNEFKELTKIAKGKKLVSCKRGEQIISIG